MGECILFFQERAEKVFKSSITLLVTFFFWFVGGCSEPLFLSKEEEVPQKAASKDTISKREDTESVDEITPAEDSHIQRKKAVSLDPVPLEEPFVKKTTDLGPAFPRVKRVTFTVPLNELHSADQNNTFFVKKMKEQSHFMVKGTVFTVQSERASFKEAEGGSFIEKLPGTSLKTREASFVEVMEQPGEGSLGMEPISFLEATESFSLERENGVFATEQLDGEFFTERGETFFMERWRERINKPVLANFDLQVVFFDLGSSTLSEEAQIVLDAKIEWLKAYPHIIHVELEGHCDSVGSERYNKGLGLKRAESVKEYLQSHGIPAEILNPVSYG